MRDQSKVLSPKVIIFCSAMQCNKAAGRDKTVMILTSRVSRVFLCLIFDSSNMKSEQVQATSCLSQNI